MFWFVQAHLVAFLVDLRIGGRRQVRIPQRQRPRPPRLTAGPRHRLDQYLLLFKPDTILRWHRDLVRRTGAHRRTKPGGRPAIPAEVEARILRLARALPRWGQRRIRGELGELGYAISASAAPQRRRATTWRDFSRSHKDQLLACDFFTVETRCLKTLHVLSFLEVGTRRVHLAGCTTRPTFSLAAPTCPGRGGDAPELVHGEDPAHPRHVVDPRHDLLARGIDDDHAAGTQVGEVEAAGGRVDALVIPARRGTGEREFGEGPQAGRTRRGGASRAGWGDLERATYLAERDLLLRDLAALDARETGDSAHLDRLAQLLASMARLRAEAEQAERNRIAAVLFAEVVTSDHRGAAVKPRPELAGFFALDCQHRGKCVAGRK